MESFRVKVRAKPRKNASILRGKARKAWLRKAMYGHSTHGKLPMYWFEDRIKPIEYIVTYNREGMESCVCLSTQY